MSDPEFWDDPDDVQPYAVLRMRIDNEAALRGLILVFNEVDHHLTQPLEWVTSRLAVDNPVVHFARGTFDARLRNLDCSKRVTPVSAPVKIDVGELQRLNKVSNDVEHGYFDQDPFHGSFTFTGTARAPAKLRGNYDHRSQRPLKS